MYFASPFASLQYFILNMSRVLYYTVTASITLPLQSLQLDRRLYNNPFASIRILARKVEIEFI
jgi:hypothetical protein